MKAMKWMIPSTFLTEMALEISLNNSYYNT
jgi:hypothetical protein